MDSNDLPNDPPTLPAASVASRPDLMLFCPHRKRLMHENVPYSRSKTMHVQKYRTSRQIEFTPDLTVYAPTLPPFSQKYEEHDPDTSFRELDWYATEVFATTTKTSKKDLPALASITVAWSEIDGDDDDSNDESAKDHEYSIGPTPLARYHSYGSVQLPPYDTYDGGPVTLTIPDPPGRSRTQVEINLEVTMRAIDFLGIEAAGVESDLHKRFPGVIPRFWHNRDSKLLILDEDHLDPKTSYMCFEIPIDPQHMIPSHHQEEETDERVFDETPSKRSKTTLGTPRSTIKAYLSHYQVDLYGLREVITNAKDSARSSKVLFGFIISALGGVLHLSYPPALDEAKLFCEVITLHERYGIRMWEVVDTFSDVLKSLKLVHSVPIPPQTPMLDDLFEFVWVMCSQSLTCLKLLAPLLSDNADVKRLLKRIINMLSLNPDRFVNFAQYQLTWESDLWELPLFHPSDFLDALKADLRQKDSFYCTNSTLKVFDKITAPIPVPSHLFSIASSIVGTNGEKSGMRRLVHLDLLVKEWPYFERLIESGLSESKTLFAELPLSDSAIELLIKYIYYPAIQPIERDIAQELVENGAQLGLFKSISYVGWQIIAISPLPTLQAVITLAADTAFDKDRYYSDALNLAHTMGLHSYWKQYASSKNGLKPEMVAELLQSLPEAR